MDATALESEARTAIAAAADPDALEELRVRYLGRKSALKLALREVRDRETGMALNAARAAIEEALEQRERELASGRLEDDLEPFDPTLPGEPVPRGSLHLITQLRRRIEDVFLGMGYVVYDGREVETVWHNFDALNQPEAHPSSDPRDTFYFDAQTLLRTHTSPSQIRAMQAQEPPIYLVSLGRTYRRDPLDATHTPVFHQVEGLAVDRGITLADLRGTIELFARRHLRPARGADADELLPLHRAVGRVRHHVLPLRRRGLRRLQALRLDRDGRRRHGRSERLRGGRLRPRGVAGVRLRARDRPDRLPAPRAARPAALLGERPAR